MPIPTSRDLVDELLLAGRDEDVCLWLGAPVDLATLRRRVAERHGELQALGVGPGGLMALWLPPSLPYVSTLLAAWRLGATVVVLDHRLTRHEVDRALAKLEPSLLVSAASGVGGSPRGHHPTTAQETPLAGRPVPTKHALVQLSSGSTGPSKIIGRTAGGLAAEIERYSRIGGMPRRGERVVVLSQVTQTFGLVGGLLHGLYAGVQVVLPDGLTLNGVIAAIAAGGEPTTVLGVPFQLDLLAAVPDPPALPQLVRAVSGGESIRPELPVAFAERYGVPLGERYGMTEVGLVAMDLAGAYRPAVGPPAPGVAVRLECGELLVSCPATPYLGEADPTRWVDGWLYTRDAATIDPATGALRILGRLDSQVTIEDTKVDLSEVEHTLAGLSGVTEAIVVYDDGIEAYLALSPSATLDSVDKALASRLAPFKRPRRLHVLPRLPRTSSGKRVRDPESLRMAVGQAAT